MSRTRDLRWNFTAAVVDAGGWNLGMGLISHLTFLPLFVQRLCPPDWPEGWVGTAIGGISGVMLFGWLVPGIFVSGWVDRLRRLRGILVAGALVERFLLLLLGLACMWLGQDHPLAVLIIFYLCWLGMNLLIGINSPGYYKLMAKLVPAEYRGRLYGLGGALAGLAGVPAALASAWLLARWGYPNGFAACLLAACAVQVVTVLPLATVREPDQPAEHAPPLQPPWRSLREVGGDRVVRLLAIGASLFWLNQAASGFYTLLAAQRFGAGGADVAAFTATLLAAKAVSYLGVGWAADRYGNRLVLQVSSLAGLAATAAVLLAPSVGWLHLAFAINEIAVQGWGICTANHLLETCPPERGATYTAAYSLLCSPARILLPVVMGSLIGPVGIVPVLALGLVGAALPLLALGRLPEPRFDSPLLGRTGLPPAGTSRTG